MVETNDIQFNVEWEEILHQRSRKDGYTPKQDVVILRIGGKIVGTLENIVCFSGLPKSGKSTFIGALLASSIIKTPVFDMLVTFPKQKDRIVYFDTESSEYDFYKNVDRIKALSYGAWSTSIDMYRCRDFEPEQFKYAIDYYLSTRQGVGIVVIDGILDLINNFNDEYESKRLINWLKQITTKYNVCIVTVMHTGKKDSNTLGHLGSGLDKYCQSTLLVERDNKEETTTLTAKMMRSDQHFNGIKIKWIEGKYKEV
jgi:hypothetical protein